MILGVIPARLNSTRFPNKILYPLNGKPVIEHVFDRSKKSSLLEDVIVAVDSEKTLKNINCSTCLNAPRIHQRMPAGQVQHRRARGSYPAAHPGRPKNPLSN